MKEAGTNGIPPGIFKYHLMKNKELLRIEEHQPLGTSPLLLDTVPFSLSSLCTLNSPPMFTGQRQLPLPIFYAGGGLCEEQSKQAESREC